MYSAQLCLVCTPWQLLVPSFKPALRPNCYRCLLQSMHGAEEHMVVARVQSHTSAVAAAPKAEEGHHLEGHIVAARVRAFERAAGRPGATAPPALGSAWKERSPTVSGS